MAAGLVQLQYNALQQSQKLLEFHMRMVFLVMNKNFHWKGGTCI